MFYIYLLIHSTLGSKIKRKGKRRNDVRQGTVTGANRKRNERERQALGGRGRGGEGRMWVWAGGGGYRMVRGVNSVIHSFDKHIP